MKMSKGIVKEKQAQIDQLEEELESYRSNTNPQMVSKLNESILLKDESIRELNRACNRADEERDDAMAHAKETEDKLNQVIKEAKEYEMEYEARYKNMKAQRDHYAAIAQLQLCFTE